LKKSIAFFDFDGTITKKDTMLELARFAKGNSGYLAGLCLISPWLVAMKFGLISKRAGKEKLLACFFGGTSIENFNLTCASFTEKIIPALIKKEALEEIKQHLREGTPVVIVSASAENWVAPWCEANKLLFICTKLQVTGKKITGKLNGENCNGKEKVNRIKELFNLENYSTVYCYGDTGGDKMMLDLASHPSYRKFAK
jgi:phosphatidylglycerophosphatase C